MSAKSDLYEFLQDFSVDDVNTAYTDLYNAVIDYGNRTGDWQFEYLFEDFVDEETVIMQIEDMLRDRSLSTIYNFISDINLNADFWKYDGYGWLQDIDDSDLEYIRDEILTTLSDEEDYE